jgi:hypothetical protein
MRVMQSVVARALVALLMIVAGVATAAAQSPVIQARTPSRGSTAGGTTVEVLGNGWFGSFGTAVTMGGTAPGCTGSAQPTNVVVHSPTRLTFVTPPRPAAATSACIITITSSSFVRTATYTYVARTRAGLPSARKPAFSYDGRYVAFESRFALAANDTSATA